MQAFFIHPLVSVDNVLAESGRGKICHDLFFLPGVSVGWSLRPARQGEVYPDFRRLQYVGITFSESFSRIFRKHYFSWVSKPLPTSANLCQISSLGVCHLCRPVYSTSATARRCCWTWSCQLIWVISPL
jgi:hypothetical protein